SCASPHRSAPPRASTMPIGDCNLSSASSSHGSASICLPKPSLTRSPHSLVHLNVDHRGQHVSVRSCVTSSCPPRARALRAALPGRLRLGGGSLSERHEAAR